MGPHLLHPLVAQLERAKGSNYKAELLFARYNAIMGQRSNRKITLENRRNFKFGPENNKESIGEKKHVERYSTTQSQR